MNLLWDSFDWKALYKYKNHSHATITTLRTVCQMTGEIKNIMDCKVCCEMEINEQTY